jgi:hypothetical protein
MDLKDGRRIAYNLEKIADCAELITQILNDNRETINFVFKDIKEKFIAEENLKKRDFSLYDEKHKL